MFPNNTIGEFYNKLNEGFDGLDSFDKKQMANGLPIVQSARGVKIHPNEPISGDKAQFDIVIRRLTANIAADLEIAVLGAAMAEAGYNNILTLPPTGTLTVEYGTNVALPNTMEFTHTVGANTDIIQVSCNQLPYPQFLKDASTDIYRVSNIRYSISDAAALDQFSNKFEFRKGTIFGLEGKNPVSVISYKKPENDQDTIIDMPLNVGMDKDTAIVLSVTDSVAPFEITLSFFVEMFEQRNSKQLFR